MDFKHTYIKEADVNIIIVEMEFVDKANGIHFRQWIEDNHPEMIDFIVGMSTPEGISHLSDRAGIFSNFDLNDIAEENWSSHTWP